jgi:dihydrofolate synthase/folylpolyglutamate synthase
MTPPQNEHRSEAAQWSGAQAEAYLLSRERFGMRFGLDRIRRLLNVLELPRVPFETVHVVGTNGKSSTARMTAALLARHGLRTACFTSPHLLSYRERIQIEERDIDEARFAAAVARTVHAADLVDRTQGAEDDLVTQFELLTAAALSEFASAGIEVAVLEAGLGGRFDATNAVDSRVAVLTNVGLEHTRYLGPTVTHIATEKLEVVRERATLVLGADLDPAALAVAERVAAERHATIVHAGRRMALDVALRARGAYQQRNFAAACAAASAHLGGPLDPAAVRDAAQGGIVPGRFHVLEGDPVTLLDGAHNAGGIDALVASLPEFLAGRPLVTRVALHDDKDPAEMLAPLLAHSDQVVCTAARSRRALPAATLASIAGQLAPHVPRHVERTPHAALERARALAGEGGAVLATGSIYLVADLLRGPGAAEGSQL